MSRSHDRQPSLASAVRAYWRLVLGLAALLTVAGLALGLVVPVSFVAQARALAGATTVNDAAVSSFGQAGSALAETYSRLLDGDAVQDRIWPEGNGEGAEVTASPVPGSSIILIEARAESEAEAEDLANRALDSLIVVVNELNDPSLAVEAARSALASAYAEQFAAESAVAAAEADAGVTMEEMQELRADLAAARASVDSSTQQLAELVSDATQSRGLQSLSTAGASTSERLRAVQLWGAVGLVLGTVLGVVCAYIFSIRDATRRTRSASARVLSE